MSTNTMTMILDAKRQSEKERAQQLEAFEKFEKGEAVVFAVHNDEKGYRLKKADLKPPKPPGHRLIRFEPIEVLMDFIVEEEDDKFEEYLESHLDALNDKDSDGMTPLHRACVENNVRIVRVLLNAGADVNAVDNDWWSPLHAASASGAGRICTMLLRAGANVALVNADGDLAVDLADDERTEAVLQRAMDDAGLSQARDECVKKPAQNMLAKIKHKIRTGKALHKPVNKQKATLMHLAACNGYEDCLRTLLEASTKGIEAKDEEGNTPLHLAAFFGEYNCVMMLALSGANIHATNMYGQKPIVMTEDPLMIKLLRSFDKQIPEFLPDEQDGSSVFRVGKGSPRFGSVRHKPRDRLPVDLS